MSEPIQNRIENGINNGIVEQIYKGDRYVFWRLRYVVDAYILNFLKDTFPDDIIIRELDKIDYAVCIKNVCCEIQSTPAYGKNIIQHSSFEQKIEKQLKQKIGKYDELIFFFDSEYLRYLQNEITSASRINWDWLYRFKKDNKIRILVIKYDGAIKETNLKDFEFISKLSQTCPLNHDADERILGRNKLKIYGKVCKLYKFTTDEFESKYKTFLSIPDAKRKAEYKNDFDNYLGRKDCSDRDRLLFYIKHATTTLKEINDMFNLTVKNRNHIRTYSHYMKILGLLTDLDTGRTGYMRKFCDCADIAKEFPGYLRNKELWDSLKSRYISYDTLCGIVTGNVDINWWKKQKGIDQAWG